MTGIGQPRIELSRLGAAWLPDGLSELETALMEARLRGSVVDLVNISPVECGLVFPPEHLKRIVGNALSSPLVAGYRPNPRGSIAARQAVANWYGRREVETDATRVLFSPGTSLGYTYSIKLLLEPGDELLVPKPGYPLFEDICRFCGVKVRYYHLKHDEDKGWSLDPEEVSFQVTPRTKAIVVVSPHNPTGHTATAEELSALGSVCRDHGLALIFDEVFCEFTEENIPFNRPEPDDFPLSILLNGLSKMASLPQWKVAWQIVQGEDELVEQYLGAADHISDTFLPMNELAMAIIPGVLEMADDVSAGLARAYEIRREVVRANSPVPVVSNNAGTYACLKLRDGILGTDMAMDLIKRGTIFVHPGEYYDLPGHLVFTVAHSPQVLRDVIGRIAAFI